VRELVIFLTILFFYQVSYTQKSLEFALTAGVTVVDLDEMVEEDEVEGTFVDDYDLFNSGVSGQFFYASKGPIAFGVEIMYHYLYWYTVSVPYVPSRIYRTYNISTFKVAPIFRFGANSMIAFDVAPVLFLQEGVNIGLLSSLNLNIPISQKLSIPIKARVDIYKGLVVTIPISLNIGLKLKL